MLLNFFNKTAPECDEPVSPPTTRTLMPLANKSDIIAIQQRFMRINQERLYRTQDSLRQRQKDFIDLLPLLFHINHPMLPGYISKATPCGIADYQPHKNSLKAARQFVQLSGVGTQLMPSFAIYSIFIMGSVGTVAHSDKSDLDIWLCYNPALSTPEIFELGKKATTIEEWAQTIELEVHFFLMDSTKFKSGESSDLSSESSGTAQHHLLLEEFYRTGLFMAGRYPAWWLIPPEFEENYDEYLQALIAKRVISVNDIIDFGGMAHIPAEEFVGAGLWQVYKGIESPYKSVLKILLMEIYSKEYPIIDLLCLRYKKAVYSGVIILDQLDPYVMLLIKLEEYLKSRNELTRLDLIRRCFYIKINVSLSSETTIRVVGWRRELIKSLVDTWGWDKDQLLFIDTHETWNINYVLKERKMLVEELTNSYLLLSTFGREHAQLLSISKNDLNILGRKLYTAFERRPEKIDIIYRGIVKEFLETHITIQQLSDQEGWLLLNSAPSKSLTQKKESIRQAPSVVSLLAWGHFNKIIGARTMIALQSRSSVLDIKEINAIVRCLKEFSPDGKLPPMETDNLKKSPQLVGASIFVNIGIDPMGRYNRSGSDLISNRGDVLNYGNSALNLAATIDLLVMTSWQEVLNFAYKETHALADSLCQYLSWNLINNEISLPPLPKVYSFSSSYSISLARRIEDLFKEACDFFLENRAKNLRYFFACGNLYYLFYIEGEGLRYIYKESLAEMQRLLTEPSPQFICTHIDRQALTETPLPLIYNANQPNIIQLFYQIIGKNVNIYILDEHGSLFYQRTSFYNDEVLINHFSKFFESALGSRSIHSQDESTDLSRIGVMFYQIKNDAGNLILTDRTYMRSSTQKNYFSVQVTSNVEHGNTNFIFHCEGRNFSSSQYGNSLFQEVTNHIMAQRRKGLSYPMYITSIDLPQTLLSPRSPDEIQMIDFLNYKKRIEDKLNEQLNLDLD